ncbi:MAG: hypothetical protein FJ291_10450 [Planctomycetes bacterium]|nr:hypothetical protein [Planctomycetota bacterium]
MARLRLLPLLACLGTCAFGGEDGPLVAYDDEQRLVKGLVFGSIGNRQSEIGNASAWPTFLANPQRSGATPHKLPDKLAEQWRVAAAPAPLSGLLLEDRRRDEYWKGPLTAPVAAAGKVVVGLADAHALAALDAGTGKLIGDVPAATAILDRFRQHAEIVETTGRSYRLKDKARRNEKDTCKELKEAV